MAVEYGYREKDKNTNKNKSRAIIILYVIFILLIGVILALYMGQSVQITHLNYELDNLETELAEIEKENHQYKLKVAKKSSLATIEKIARNKINMIDPEKTEIVVLHKPSEPETPPPVNPEGEIQVVQFFTRLMENIGTVKADSPD